MESGREPTFENALAFAQDLIRIPSPSGEEEEVARRVIEEYETLGFEDVGTDDVGNVIGVVRGTGDAPSVLLNCHLDVVAEGDHSEWEFPPFSGTVEKGFLHGRGAMDIKGPLALQTYAAATLMGRARGDIIVAHTVFEERGGLGMQRLLDSGVAPGAIVIGESTHGDVCIGHRGRGEVEVVIHGLAGHASVPSRATNALDLVPAVLSAVHKLAATQAEHPVLGRSTLVATGVDVLPESRNVIPDKVTVVVDWRVLPGATHEWMEQSVDAAVRAELPDLPDGLTVEVRMAAQPQTTYTGITSERSLFTPGFVMDADDPIVRAAAQAVGRRDEAGPSDVRPWAFATDGGWSCGVHGIPTVGFAPGEERYAHTNRERLDLDEARWSFGRYPILIDALHGALL
ncbi:MAG: YgeY family selenium metabolism-linked hydrolase [Gemmatimonadota bacterium]|nr:MAG: YgeY family selenium metabolism-linked hydrolase [Gemmatimonadota bacterium]